MDIITLLQVAKIVQHTCQMRDFCWQSLSEGMIELD